MLTLHIVIHIVIDIVIHILIRKKVIAMQKWNPVLIGNTCFEIGLWGPSFMFQNGLVPHIVIYVMIHIVIHSDF